MIDREIAKEQLKRLAEFDGFHALTKEAMEDYLYAIETAETRDIAERVINEIKSDEAREKMPSSAFIRRRMNEENDRPKGDPALNEFDQWKKEAIEAGFDMKKANAWIVPNRWH